MTEPLTAGAARRLAKQCRSEGGMWNRDLSDALDSLANQLDAKDAKIERLKVELAWRPTK